MDFKAQKTCWRSKNILRNFVVTSSLMFKVNHLHLEELTDARLDFSTAEFEIWSTDFRWRNHITLRISVCLYITHTFSDFVHALQEQYTVKFSDFAKPTLGIHRVCQINNWYYETSRCFPSNLQQIFATPRLISRVCFTWWYGSWRIAARP